MNEESNKTEPTVQDFIDLLNISNRRTGELQAAQKETHDLLIACTAILIFAMVLSRG